MKNRKGGGLSLIITLFIAFILLKTVVPLLVGLAATLVKVVIIAFVVLVIAIICGSLFRGNKGAEEKKSTVDTKVKGSAGQEYFNMSAEDAEKIKLANKHILAARSLSSRINNLEVRRASEETLLAADKIVKTLKQQPDEIKKCRQLINYYLPTLVVVLEKYKTVEDGGVSADDTVEKLKTYLADIKSALDNMYDGLFNNERFDIDVETEAMRAVLKRDGLISEDDIQAATSTELAIYNPEEAGK